MLFYTELAILSLEMAMIYMRGGSEDNLYAVKIIYIQVKYKPVKKDFMWKFNLKTWQSFADCHLSFKRKKKKKASSL